MKRGGIASSTEIKSQSEREVYWKPSERECCILFRRRSPPVVVEIVLFDAPVPDRDFTGQRRSKPEYHPTLGQMQHIHCARRFLRKIPAELKRINFRKRIQIVIDVLLGRSLWLPRWAPESRGFILFNCDVAPRECYPPR